MHCYREAKLPEGEFKYLKNPCFPCGFQTFTDQQIA